MKRGLRAMGTGFRVWVFMFLAGWLGCSAAVGAQDAGSEATKTVRLLTVGNSFSRNATQFLPELVKKTNHTLIHRSIVVGGASLELHSGKAKAHDLDSLDKAGLYDSGLGLQEELAARRWDYVTIQQASIKSHDLATYRPYAGELKELIERYAPDAQILVHQTWAYRRDDPRFEGQSVPGEPDSREAMYEGLTRAYRLVATELGARLIPVGDAFDLGDNDALWGYEPDRDFDFASASPPSLPEQLHSLHVGWRWAEQEDGRMKLKMDGHHANTAGEYLGACVFYEVIFGESVVGNTYVPRGLDRLYARFLRETAHRAVQQSARYESGLPERRDRSAPERKGEKVPVLINP